MVAERSFVVSVNDGADTVHDRAKLSERCNTDDVVGRKVVDEYTAEALLLRGDAVACKHCIGEKWG